MKQKTNLFSLSIAYLLILSLAMAPSAFADPKTLEGSWTIENDDGNIALVSYHGDGTTLLTVPGFPAGHGVWEKVDSRTFVAKTIAVSDGDPIVISTVTDIIEISDDGQTYVSEFETVLTLLDGTEIGTVTGSTTGSRITLD